MSSSPLMRKFLIGAELLDAYRFMPRFVLLMYGYLIGHLGWDIWQWFKTVDPTEYTDIQFAAMIGFPTALLAFFGKLFIDLYGQYRVGGRDWTKNGCKE